MYRARTAADLMIGARLFHVIDHWPDEYALNPIRVLYIWEGRRRYARTDDCVVRQYWSLDRFPPGFPDSPQWQRFLDPLTLLP